MPQSYSFMLTHLIFATKDRRPLIPSETRADLNAYIAGTVTGIGCSPVIVNCVDDHVHALLVLGREMSVSDAAKKIKANSSRWIKTRPGVGADFQWQRGYSAFSVSRSNMEQVRAYVARQEDHHKKVSFVDELNEILRRHGIEAV